jgi:hypothetical protein
MARHAMNSEEHQKTFSEMAAKGLRPVCLSGYGFRGEADYAAVWEDQRTGTSDWVGRHGLSSGDYRKALEELSAKNYRPVLLSGYTVKGEDLFAAIWVKNDGTEWSARHDIDGPEY